MKSKTRLWFGVGAFVVAGTGAMTGGPLAKAASAGVAPRFATDTAIPRSAGVVVAQGHVAQEHADHPPQGGEGGESKGIDNLPPDLAFSVRIAILRGHLLIGDELVRQKHWDAALPHFLHPTEEIYGDIKDKLADYNVQPFDDTLKMLADVVKAKKSAAYAKALKAVNDALATADSGMKAKEADWAGFVTESAVEAMKSAASEYEEAIVDGNIVKPVEYQDARGFIWQGAKMIESVAPALQKKDAAGLKQVRAGIAALKKVFPTAVPPRKAVQDHAALLGLVSRIELAAGKLM
jgi:hypothetical protein